VKTITILTDFSSSARNAMEYAFHLFKYSDTKNILLNVYREPQLGEDMLISITDLLEKESRRRLSKERQVLTSTFSDNHLQVTQRAEYGTLVDVVNHILRKEHIDLIVMGSKGASGIQKSLVGSNTVDVIRKVHCPVLVVPEKTTYEPPVHIVLATDGKNLKAGHSLELLVELTQQASTELLVVKVEPEIDLLEENKLNAENRRLNQLLKNVPHHFYSIQHRNPVIGIDTFVRENRVDLLAMVAERYHSFDRLVYNSFSEQMSMLADAPLLILRGD